MPYLQQLLLPMSSQYTISTPYIQSERHLFCPSPVRTLPCSPYLLHMSSQFITSFIHIQLEYHLYYSCLFNIPYLLPSSSQNTTCPIHVQSLHHLSCKSHISHHLSFPNPVSSSPLLPISDQNTTSNSKGCDL